MARLRADGPGDAYPSSPPGTATRRALPANEDVRRSPRKKAPTTTYIGSDGLECLPAPNKTHIKPKTAPASVSKVKQIRLAPLSSLKDATLLGSNFPQQPSPRRQVRPNIQYKKSAQPVSVPSVDPSNANVAGQTGSVVVDEENVEADIEESVWCGSDASSGTSDDELPSPRKLIRFRSTKQTAVPEGETLDLYKRFHSLRIDPSEANASAPPPPQLRILSRSRPTSSSDKENDAEAILRLSPPRLYSPRKEVSSARPTTPPASPSNDKLRSPSKRPPRVPTPPFRQSLDAFWDAEAVNDWNQQYSPRKEWSPRKAKILEDRDSSSPTGSPRKMQSPSKRTKAELALKKDWEVRKHRVAEDFLTELDDTITDGRIRELALSTGGIRLIWSKTLNSTAGRANWRRETIRTRAPDGTSSTTHHHHASIELAEKVIHDASRLLNVLAHEFCHLANFMISGIKDQPHGKQFKAWGQACTRAFADRGVAVTTKHSYEIEYKYIWRCCDEACGVEFQRHSKSVDTKRHACGVCRGRLVQVKPVPRKGNGGGGGGVVTGYAAYVQEHFAAVKAGLGRGSSQKEVMEAIGRRYRAEKAGTGSVVPGSLASSGGGGEVKGVRSEAFDVDDVVRKLDSITIADD
ncbi:hypothetical protein LTR62_002530 [Meristemomyces frigidus]|uniref:SprT-like domain-containing protein n=1 Tax=Meristemomyces frigidus TaxID=1508187 RepID=A0AAN7TKQ8_9PEZI|nr:hypothetical protein LTR62_002530 [Meristemomyces frigidus]